MPQSLSAVYLHLVFSAKDRHPFLRDSVPRSEIHAYLGGISKQLDCTPIIIGGLEDHVHILARHARTITQADWVKELKRVSSQWIKDHDSSLRDFSWQSGYGVFSVSASTLETVATSPIRKSITKRPPFRTNTAPSSNATPSHGTRNMFGIEWNAPPTTTRFRPTARGCRSVLPTEAEFIAELERERRVIEQKQNGGDT